MNRAVLLLLLRRRLLLHASFGGRWLSTNTSETRLIRNIGLVAHIDAGKTTTTERMLYYSGLTASMGEVHEGDTVMDWMAAERERGISITSAAAAIAWRRHRLNLLDTPGHVDFTFEVERSLSVLDGAIVILDGSAGVQAQTLKVWLQADRYQLPRLLYLNKMDKAGASVEGCLESVRRRLSVETVLQLQLPIFNEEEGGGGGGSSGNNHQLLGLIDLVTGRLFQWPADHRLSEDGKRFNVEALLETENGEIEGGSKTEAFLEPSTRARLTERLLTGRERLIGQLADADEALAETVVLSEHSADHLAAHLPPPTLHAAIRRCTLTRKAVPLLLGSSYRNIGVQPLLDAVVHYLPSPLEATRAKAVREAAKKMMAKDGQGEEEALCALAFKSTTDRRLGPLTYLRLYAGRLPVTGQTSVVNVSRGAEMQSSSVEKITRVYRPFADHFADLGKEQQQQQQHSNSSSSSSSSSSFVSLGDIVVVSGLNSVRTGDTLLAEGAVSKQQQSNHQQQQVPFAGIDVPEPVYYCALEAPSLSKMRQLETALEQLTREDPSFQVVLADGEGGSGSKDRGAASANQIVVKGMGELHIEILKDRLKREHGLEVTTGPLQIAYCESLTEVATASVDLRKTIGGVVNAVQLELELRPLQPLQKKDDQQHHHQQLHLLSRRKDLQIKVVNSRERNLSAALRPWHLKWLRAGVFKALEHGPLFGFPVTALEVALVDYQAASRTTEAFFTHAATQCALEALRSAALVLLEPVMRLEITAPESSLGVILADLSSRRCEFGDSTVVGGGGGGGDGGGQRMLVALVPLAELSTYATTLRRVSSGMASFDMALHSYRPMDQTQTERAIRAISGVDY